MVSFTKIFSRFLLLAFVCLMILMFTGCKSKLKLVEKKQETVSVLESNDIKTAEETIMDVETFILSSSQKITIKPNNNKLPARIIKGKDTLDIFNADVVIENNSSSETKKDKSNTEKSTSDKSTKKSESDSSEKTVDIKKTGTHPAFIWGGLLLILIVIVLAASWSYLKKKLPFL